MQTVEIRLLSARINVCCYFTARLGGNSTLRRKIERQLDHLRDHYIERVTRSFVCDCLDMLYTMDDSNPKYRIVESMLEDVAGDCVMQQCFASLADSPVFGVIAY